MEAQKEEDDATELDGALADADNKVEQLTSSSSSKKISDEFFGNLTRSGSVRAVPETCDQMADLISDLAEATSVAESLSIVKEILQSTITRCTDKSKLSTVGKKYQFLSYYT